MPANTIVVHPRTRSWREELLSELLALPDRVTALEKEIVTLRKAARPSEKKWLSLKEAAAMLGVSEKTVSRFIQRRLLRRTPMTSLVRILREDVETLAKTTL